MSDFLDVLAKDALKTIEEGYYETPRKAKAQKLSLKEAILKAENAAIISEIKFASPLKGSLKRIGNLQKIAKDLEDGGAAAISVLTEPKHFRGNLDFVSDVRDCTKIPILMKDIILSPVQIDAARTAGADAILLIQGLFQRGYAEKPANELIEYVHSKGLEVLLEAHTDKEFSSALESSADMVGINNRNLTTLEVDLDVTRRILLKHPNLEKVIVSESGINNPEDARLLKNCGVTAFLVGTAVMKSPDMKEKVRELVAAL